MDAADHAAADVWTLVRLLGSDDMRPGKGLLAWHATRFRRRIAGRVLQACETLLHVVAGMPPGDYPSCLLDRLGELGRAFAANGPPAIIVDVADVLRQPTPDAIAARVTQLYAVSRPAVVRRPVRPSPRQGQQLHRASPVRAQPQPQLLLVAAARGRAVDARTSVRCLHRPVDEQFGSQTFWPVSSGSSPR